jgi:hypothetical protein
MKRDISKNYDSLTPEERFRLFMKAAARGDEREQERLSKTCPHKTYDMQDAAYIDRLVTLRHLTGAYLMGLEYQHGKLDSLELVEELSPLFNRAIEVMLESAYRRGLEDGGGEEIPEGAVEEALKARVDFVPRIVQRHFDMIRRVIASRIRMEMDVFNEVCREKMNLEPEEALADIRQALDWLDLEALENAGADEQPEELDSESDELLQEGRETLESAYVTAWERATGE